MSNAIAELLLAMANCFALHPAVAAGQVSASIADVAHLTGRNAFGPSTMQAKSRPALPALLDPALDRTLAAAACDLVWWVPDADKIPPGMTSKMWVCELIGPDGMLHDDSFRTGLYLQGPDLVYDWHSHAADELYIVLSGVARWQATGRPPSHPAPMTCIHHAPWQSHAMITSKDPLLTLWAWTGDIGFDTYRMD